MVMVKAIGPSQFFERTIMVTKKNSSTRTFKLGRHAGNGRFIPVAQAVAMGNRAVVETIKVITKPKQ
jgi:hypothetical protein